jgi:hypothetical protein
LDWLKKGRLNSKIRRVLANTFAVLNTELILPIRELGTLLNSQLSLNILAPALPSPIRKDQK